MSSLIFFHKRQHEVESYLIFMCRFASHPLLDQKRKYLGNQKLFTSHQKKVEEYENENNFNKRICTYLGQYRNEFVRRRLLKAQS